MRETFYESKRDNTGGIIHLLLYNVECDMHFHIATEILFVRKGKVRYSCSSETDILQAGEAVFLPSFFSHKFQAVGESETETLMIPHRFLNNFQKYYQNVSFPKLNDRETNKEIYPLFQEIETRIKENANEFLLAALVDHILALIATNYPAVPYSKMDTLMVDIVKYINDNLANISSITDVSGHFGYNPSYFSRLFKKLFEIPFSTYINRLRCDFIEERRGTASVSDLLYQAGYGTSSTYYRNKTKTNRPPQQ